MNYKTAKGLRDAGFPQGSFGDFVGKFVGKYDVTVCHIPNSTDQVGTTNDWMYVPTLSELIEAVGDDFFQLSFGLIERCWYANGRNGTEGEATTPEEAVANLYIALKK